ncbi:MAG TPA: hypothetical protein VEK06_02795, partial [Myxococcota bacterium]|nr:hypothetical protein [Myxococcota bacterium]
MARRFTMMEAAVTGKRTTKKETNDKAEKSIFRAGPAGLFVGRYFTLPGVDPMSEKAGIKFEQRD